MVAEADGLFIVSEAAFEDRATVLEDPYVGAEEAAEVVGAKVKASVVAVVNWLVVAASEIADDDDAMPDDPYGGTVETIELIGAWLGKFVGGLVSEAAALDTPYAGTVGTADLEDAELGETKLEDGELIGIVGGVVTASIEVDNGA
ncbi:uncharacterized protein RCC_00444 [Ramularia collo-cygni]|uniref:Uncharacterized protein n=1 Tax=Ramularia collo-cygni TaxID=112498 RepID=A0A2D3US95_9PEZI|nr:uncharacterized protein RCC_00444 [Ramularia collo-cygni]CZT14467.1 uncharacterized protein RCC_00444 [Ramularia collo-cygni]